MQQEWRYADQILYVNLTDRTVAVERTSTALKRDYIGGVGFVARLLADVAPHPESEPAVVLAAGPLSDEMAGRLAMGAAPSPTGRLAVSSMGGRMAAALKSAGFDAIVIQGCLAEPASLVLDPDEVRILPAADLWGMEVPAAEGAIRRQLGRGYASMILGPAAEHRIPFATMAHEEHHAGGSGVAAVLGGMLLKSLSVWNATEVPSFCTGCTLNCPSTRGALADRAGELGLDAPTATRLEALVRGCSDAGILRPVGEPLVEIAHRQGIGQLLANGEAAAISVLGPVAEEIATLLPKPKKRSGIGVADLLGTCQRTFRDRPGEVLRTALSQTLGLTSSAS